MIKKISAFLISIAIVITVISSGIPTSLASGVVVVENDFSRLSSLMINSFRDNNYTVDVSNLDLKLEKVDGQFNLPENIIDLISDCFNYVKSDFPEFLMLENLSGNYNYRYNSSSGRISKISFLSVGEPASKEDLEDFNSRVDAIAKDIPDFSNDYEKVLYVYTYIAQNYEYDADADTGTRNPYEFLIKKKGVCQAYMLLFKAIMDRLGIECISAYHDSPYPGEAGHTWNMVKINEKWYHIDCTFSDPVLTDETGNQGELLGYVGYEYLLIDTKTLYALDNEQFESNYSEESLSSLTDEQRNIFEAAEKEHSNFYTLYEKTGAVLNFSENDFANKVWNETNTAMTYCNNSWYFTALIPGTNNSALYRATEDLEDKYEIKKLNNIRFPAYDDNGQLLGYYPGYFGNIFTLGNYVCYSAVDHIEYYDTVNLTTGTLELESSEFSATIYSCIYDGHGTVTLELKDSPSTISANAEIKQYSVKAMSEYNSLDLVKAKKHLLGIGQLDNWGLYDVAENIGFDIRDLQKMKKMSAKKVPKEEYFPGIW